jgi:hypothetical protein
MRIHPFIFCWKGHYNKALELEKIFLNIFGRVTVINSDENNRPENWINLTDEAYFAEQFVTACNLFDGDIMFHVQADVSYENWTQVAESAVKYYNKYKFGIYAPNIDFTDVTNVNLSGVENMQDSNLKLVSNTDCSAWFIDGNVIEYFKNNFKNDYLNTKFGWGICLCLSAICLKIKKLVMRDYSFTLKHPKHRGYNTSLANSACDLFYKKIRQNNMEIYENIFHLKFRNTKKIVETLDLDNSVWLTI